MPGRSRAVVNSDYKYEIEGLRQFIKALKSIEEEFPGQLREANFDLANELAKRSKSRAGSVGGVARKAADSLRATRTTNYAAVAGGGARYPYFFGAEFGAKRYHQFKSWRGNQHADNGWDGGPGYFLHPTIRDEARSLIDQYMERLDALYSQAFPDE